MNNKLKILVNATTCVVGGAVQSASAFISKALDDDGNIEYFFVVSEMVNKNILNIQNNIKYHKVILPSPARLLNRTIVRKKLTEIEKSFAPHVILTIFGPAYHHFRGIHICGFADGWLTHPSAIALSVVPWARRIIIKMKCIYKYLHLSSKDYYFVEAEVARIGLINKLSIQPSKISVIPNTYSNVFESTFNSEDSNYEKNIVRILCLSAPYVHKNLTIIPEVAYILKKRDRKKTYRFFVTLPNDGYIVRKFWAKCDRYSVKGLIENIGVLMLKECPKWYNFTDMVFTPTLLETFSATYPEAMKMKRPIVTTDLDFAHDICRNAAAYYSPLSALAAAREIQKVAENHEYRETLVENGRLRLKELPSPDEKYGLMIEWIRQVLLREKYHKS